MRKLKEIEIFLDDPYSADEQKDFICRSRCICNFVERHLVRRGVESECSRINIHCTKANIDCSATRLKGPPFLEVKIHYDVPPVQSMTREERMRCFGDIIREGMACASNYISVPLQLCDEAILSFESIGYVNEWTQCKKSWRVKGCILDSQVMARLTEDRFSAIQEVRRGGDLIAKRVIAETLPREGLFYPYLGNLSMESKSSDIVYRRGSRVISRFSTIENKWRSQNGPEKVV